MPIMRVKEIRDMSSEDRTKRLSELKTELLRLKTMIKAGGMVESPARIKQLRRTIAQILTIEREQKRERGAKQPKVEPEKKKEKKEKKEKKAEKTRKGKKGEKREQ